MLRVRLGLASPAAQEAAPGPIMTEDVPQVPVPAPDVIPDIIPVGEVEPPGSGPAAGSAAGSADGSAEPAEPGPIAGPEAARQREVAGTAGTGGAGTESELLRRIEILVSKNLVYPPLARKRNIEGVVQLSLLIGTDGRLTKNSVTSGSGSSILDKAAIALVEAIFPLGLDHELGHPVTITIRIEYSLTS